MAEVLELQIKDNALDAASGLTSLSDSLSKIKKVTSKGFGLQTVSTELTQFTEALNKADTGTMVSNLDKLAASLEKIKTASSGLNLSGLNLGNIMNGSTPVGGNTPSMVISQVTDSSNEAVSALQQVSGSASTATSELREASQAIEQEGASANSSARNNTNYARSFRDLMRDIGGLSNGILGQIAKMTRMRILRTIAKEILASFKEGFENLYGWSSYMGGSFAKSIDSAKASLGGLKNSLATALAPAVQALIPVFNSIISVVQTACNWIAQFFALLTGATSWTSATDSAAASLDNVKKSAGGAGGAMKDLLADFDELNIIQSNSGGGGGGSKATDYSQYANMFQENFTFDDDIKEFVTWLEEHLPVVNGLIAGIIASLLGFKMPLVLTITGITIGYSAGYDAGLNGWNATNITEAITGALISGLGLSLIGGVPGFILGVLVSAVGTLIGFTIGKSKTNAAKLGEDGKYHLTEEQVKKYVSSMFEMDVEAVLNIIKTTLENAENVRADVTKSLQGILVNMNLIKLGLASDETYDELNRQITGENGLISKLQTLCESEQSILKLSFDLVPAFNAAGENVSAEYLSAGLTGWKGVEEYVTQLGTDISSLLTTGMVNGVKLSDEEKSQMIQSILTDMSEITNAITSAETIGMAEANLVTGLGQLDTMSALEVTKLFNDYKEAVAEGNKQIYTENMQSFLKLSNAYSAMGNGELAQTYYAMYTNLRDNMNENLERALYNDTHTGSDLIQNWLTEQMSTAFSTITRPDGIDYSVIKHMLSPDVLGIPGWKHDTDKFIELPVAEIAKNFKSSLEYELNMTEPMVLKAAKSFGFTEWDILSGDIQTQMLNAMTDALGANKTVSVLKELGYNITSDVAKGMGENFYEIANAAGIISDTVQKELTDNPVEIAVDVNGEGIANEVKEAVEGKTYNVKASASVNISVNTTVQAKVNAGTKNVSSVIANGISFKTAPTVEKFATGGYPDTGDLFIANEDGAEMVGKIGGKTAVANNQQIIQGITNGVRDANTEQNSLLRQQNQLLTQLLNKKLTAQVVPSPALGRVNAQSQQMYARMVGEN